MNAVCVCVCVCVCVGILTYSRFRLGLRCWRYYGIGVCATSARVPASAVIAVQYSVMYFVYEAKLQNFLEEKGIQCAKLKLPCIVLCDCARCVRLTYQLIVPRVAQTCHMVLTMYVYIYTYMRGMRDLRVSTI